MLLKTKGKFEAGHCLSLPYESACTNQHGHTYHTEIEININTNYPGFKFRNGMVIDFSRIKECFKCLDHTYLNDSLALENPTAEMTAIWIRERIRAVLEKENIPPTAIRWIKVAVWETENNCVIDEYPC